MTARSPFEQFGRDVIQIEADALAALAQRVDAQFARACEIILAGTGRVVVTGMGKSGHVGNKIAATLASTGTPSFFVHPGEASHGDLGMITPADVVLALSNSGETDEILLILPIIKRMGAKLIALTGNRDSSLARRRRRARLRRGKGGLPAQSRAHRQHHRGARRGRRACRGAAEFPRFHARRLRARTRPDAWGGGCWCTSATSCAPAMPCRW